MPRKSPKKHLGQNFLVDKNIIAQFHQYYRDSVASLPVGAVWEIGAGLAALSAGLQSENRPLYLFEVDPHCTRYLQEHFREEIESNTLYLLPHDVLLVWDRVISKDVPIAITGNLPFNIASKIIHKALIQELPIPYLLFIIQREVAERYTHRTDKNAGRTITPHAILAQARYNVRISRNVNRQAFYPKPHIEASIIEFHAKQTENPQLAIHSLNELLDVLFRHRRKQIQRSINLATRSGADRARILLIPEACHKVGIPVSSRPEEIDLQQWIALAQCYEALIQASKQ